MPEAGYRAIVSALMYSGAVHMDSAIELSVEDTADLIAKVSSLTELVLEGMTAFGLACGGAMAELPDSVVYANRGVVQVCTESDMTYYRDTAQVEALIKSRLAYATETIGEIWARRER